MYTFWHDGKNNPSIEKHIYSDYFKNLQHGDGVKGVFGTPKITC